MSLRCLSPMIGAIALTALGACADPVAAPNASPAATPVVSPPAFGVTSQGWPVTWLGTLPFGQFSEALDINAATTVVGYSAYDFSGNIHAFRWTQGTGMVDLGDLSHGAVLGVFQSAAFAINDKEEIVGWSDAPHGNQSPNRAFFWSAATGMVELPSDTTFDARAYDITSAGVVIGNGVLPGKKRSQILRWDRNATGTWGVTGLGEPAAAGGQSIASGINDFGNVVGSYPSPTTWTGFFRRLSGSYATLGLGTRATRIIGARFVGEGGKTAFGGVTDPGAGLPWDWPSLAAGPYSLGYLYRPGGEASDLTAGNHVVGTIAGLQGVTTVPYTRAFYWDCVGGMTDLGSLGNDAYDDASAKAINANDIVAGSSNHIAAIWGVTPSATSVVPLPFHATCVDPPVVVLLPGGLLRSGLLSRPGFDATRIDPNSVTIGDGFGHVTPIARTVPGGPPRFSIADVNADGVPDLRVSFSTTDMINSGVLTRQSFQLVVAWVDATGLPGSGKYPIRVQ